MALSLKLAAWGLKLATCSSVRLVLEACGLYPLAVAHASWISSIMVGRVLVPPWLVFGVCDMFNFSRPAASTALTLVALLRCRTVAARVHNRGPMSPGVAGLAVVLRVA